MKTLKMLFKMATGTQVLKLSSFWLICLGFYILFITNSVPMNYFSLLLTFFIVWTIGYLFSIATHVVKNEANPLAPIQFVKAFVLGFWVSTRLIFIFGLLVIGGMILSFIPKLFQYFEWISLIYIVLVVAPYLLLITVYSDNMPWIKGWWTLFKKNANDAFAFIFWQTLSFVLYFYFAIFTQQFMTSLGASICIAIISFILFFWLLVFNAVLLGFFAKRAVKEPLKQKKIEDKTKWV